MTSRLTHPPGGPKFVAEVRAASDEFEPADAEDFLGARGDARRLRLRTYWNSALQHAGSTIARRWSAVEQGPLGKSARGSATLLNVGPGRSVSVPATPSSAAIVPAGFLVIGSTGWSPGATS